MTDALSAEQRSSLEKLVQKARRWIEDDLEAKLAGTFGINADGRIEDVGDLSLSNAQASVRDDLVEIVEFLRSEGEDDEGSVARLVREAAFTHTNRLIAVRVAEAIGLLPETLAKGTASSGFRDFSELAPTVATTEWGRFAEFVRLCADELAADVPALFDPRNPLLELTMSETVLARVVETISEHDDELWGAPDALGWSYQFFNTDADRREARYRHDGSPKPPESSQELAVRNQFFTPSYVVDFLIHNGLGAHLAAGYPGLEADLPLLVEVPTQPTDVDLEALSVLDPACGSGHFLLGAYDVLEKAWERAGSNPTDAAPAIVRSLCGIDIDPRAAQIAQAAVMFRARRHCRSGKLPTPNVMCARSLPAGPEIDAIVGALPEHVGRVVKGVADELVYAPLLGSLLKVEERLSLDLQDVFGTGVVEGTLSEGESGGTDAVREAVFQALSAIADVATSSAAQRLFVAEAKDAVRFVDAMVRRHSFVLANPPFGVGCPVSESYLKAAYPESWTELYACFVERCLELATCGVGAITSSTFLTTSRLKVYRQRLAARGLTCVVDLGAGVLHGATVNTAIVSIVGSKHCDYLDLRFSSQKPDDLASAVDGGSFQSHDLATSSALPNSPFAFHASESVLELWGTGMTLDPAFASVRTGGKTFDNFRYVRAWWELGAGYVDRGWRQYEKGGEYQPFYAPTRLCLNWKADGAELKEYGERTGRLAQVMQSAAYWGGAGICFPRMSSVGFSARIMPAGEIFADTSIAVLPKRENEIFGILGLLNTTVAAEILGVFGRGRSTENNSVKSLPVDAKWIADPEVCRLSAALVGLFLELEAAREVSPAFAGQIEVLDPNRLRAAGEQAATLQRELDERLTTLIGLNQRIDDSITQRPELNRSLFDAEAEDDYGERLLSVLVGIAMGRWSPTQQVVEHPNTVMEPPRPISAPPNFVGQAIDVLLEEPGSSMDLATRVQVLADQLLRDSAATAAFSALLRRQPLRRYLQARFFDAHLKRYSGGGRKAPIYWQLQVPSKSWGIWLYAPRLCREVLFGIVAATERRQRLAEQQIRHLQREAESGAGGRKASEVAKELEAEQKLTVELASFRTEAERIANLGWEPDLDDGMVLNAAPLADLFPAWKDAAAYRKELRAGKYEWATVARYADQL